MVRISQASQSVNSSGEQIVEISNNRDPATSSKQDEQIAQTLNKNGYAQVLLTSTNGTAVKADTTLTVQDDPEKREGWNCVNPVSSTKLNLYYFSGSNEIITLGELSSVYFKGFINVNTEFSSLPFINVYTKPTGSNDAQPWYHSRITYEYNNDNTIGIGEECVFFGKGSPSTEFNNRKIQLNNVIVDGQGLDSEEILYIVVSTNSLATVNSVDTTLNILGFNTSNIRRNLVLTTEPASLPLPSGAATSILQTTANGHLSSIDSALGGTLQVNGSLFTQPVSGAVSILGNVSTSVPIVNGSNNNYMNGVSVTSASNGSSYYVGSFSKFSFMGNTTNQNEQINIEFSPDGTNWYRINTSLYPTWTDPTSPYDFYQSFNNECVAYVRLNFSSYTGTHTVNCTILTQ